MILFSTKKPQISINLDDSINLTFNAPKSIINDILALKNDFEYDIKLTNHKKTRSLTQNGLMWVLLGELSVKLKLGRNELYKSYVKDYGIFNVLPVKQELSDRFIETWSLRGLGWFCDRTQSKLNGYENLIVYYGTSSYTKEEMARILDAIIFDCNENDIPVTIDYKEMEV